MNKLQQIIVTGSGIAIGAAILGFAHSRLNHQRSLTTRTHQIGQELITNTNSLHLISLRPGLAGQLSDLLGSPTRVAAVLPGDEPAPVGDGSACSRLILTNQLAKGLEFRLGYASDPEKLEILGYWPLGQPSIPR